MKTWNDYKEHVRTVDPEIGKDIDEVENISSIVSAMVEQRTSLGLSQRELAAMCGIPQSSVARIESCKTTPNLGTLLNIFQHLGLQLTVKTYKTYRLKSRRISAKRFSLSESHRIMPNGSWAIPPVGNLTLP